MIKKYIIILLLLVAVLPFRVHAESGLQQISARILLAQESEQEDGEDRADEDDFRPADVTQQTPQPAQQQTVGTNTEVPALNANSITSAPVEQTFPAEIPVPQPTVQAPTPVISVAFPWAWIVTRSTGIASFILLALMTVIGIALTTGLIFRMWSPSTAWSVHRAIASVLLVSVVLHVGSLLFDSFLNMHLTDILIPFTSFFRTTLVALGTIGFYLLLAILGTSLYTMTKYVKFWRFIHYFGFVMFVLLFLHGVLIGTDTGTWWMKIIYWSCALTVTGFGVYRLVWKFRKQVS
ncbi:MAG: ferric reductase-like transmembrane domain-containing protein [Patescibacteria group bacterium]|jgi:sulfoxide reductase heme-binding subunit YedZ